MIRIAVILITIFISDEVLADIYKYVDSDGLTHYTNTPGGNSQYKRILRTQPRYFTPVSTGTRSFSRINKSKFADLINQVADKHHVDARLVHAVIQAESAYNAGAISSAGAVGLMQLMPDTARRYGVSDRRDPDQNVEGGTRYLKDLIEMFNANLGLAVAAYNAGENAVIKYNYTIPPYPETQNYVKQVLALYNRMSL